jgi:hypothetical protein
MGRLLELFYGCLLAWERDGKKERKKEKKGDKNVLS